MSPRETTCIYHTWLHKILILHVDSDTIHFLHHRNQSQDVPHITVSLRSYKLLHRWRINNCWPKEHSVLRHDTQVLSDTRFYIRIISLMQVLTSPHLDTPTGQSLQNCFHHSCQSPHPFGFHHLLVSVLHMLNATAECRSGYDLGGGEMLPGSTKARNLRALHWIGPYTPFHNVHRALHRTSCAQHNAAFPILGLQYHAHRVESARES